jgi:hypothetical protein
MASIANSSSMFDEVLTTDLIEEVALDERGLLLAPNFLRLDRGRAMARAREMELNVLCKGDGGAVVAQDPDPGVAMEHDEVLRLYLSPPKAKRRTAPDLRGLPIRVAKRRAVQAGMRCDIIGTGVVKSQKPAPGTATTSDVMTIYCKDPFALRIKS